MEMVHLTKPYDSHHILLVDDTSCGMGKCVDLPYFVQDLEIFAVQEEIRRRDALKKRQEAFNNSTVTGVVLQRFGSVKQLLVSDLSIDSEEEKHAVNTVIQGAPVKHEYKSISRKNKILTKDIDCLIYQLRRYEKKYGAEDARTLRVMNNLGVAYYGQRKYVDAERCFLMAYEGRAVALNLHDEITIDSLFNLATTVARLGKHEEAIGHFEKCLRVREVLYGDHHEDTFAVINNMAWTYTELRAEKLALGLYDYILQCRLRQQIDYHAAQTPEIGLPTRACANTEKSTHIPFSRSPKRVLAPDINFLDDTNDDLVVSQCLQPHAERICTVNVLRAKFNLALCHMEFHNASTAVSLLQECKSTCVQIFGAKHRASVRIIHCLCDAENREAFLRMKCRLMGRSYYSNDSLIARDRDVVEERSATRSTRATRGCTVGSGGVIRNPDKWIDEALYGAASRRPRIDPYSY